MAALLLYAPLFLSQLPCVYVSAQSACAVSPSPRLRPRLSLSVALCHLPHRSLLLQRGVAAASRHWLAAGTCISLSHQGTNKSGWCALGPV